MPTPDAVLDPTFDADGVLARVYDTVDRRLVRRQRRRRAASALGAAALLAAFAVGIGALVRSDDDPPSQVTAGEAEAPTAAEVEAAVREWKAQMVQVPWLGEATRGQIYRDPGPDVVPEVSLDELIEIIQARPCCQMGPGTAGPPIAYLTHFQLQHAFEPGEVPAPGHEVPTLAWVVVLPSVPVTTVRPEPGSSVHEMQPSYFMDEVIVVNAETGGPLWRSSGAEHGEGPLGTLTSVQAPG